MLVALEAKKEKIPFKIHKNVICLFLRVVHLSDENFAFKDCEQFFKSVIRNSTKRSESNMIRSSTAKRRPQNLAYKTQKYSESIIEKDKHANSMEVINEENRESSLTKSEHNFMVNET